MNQTERYRRNEVVEIDLVDLFRRILKKWKKGLLFFMIGALIGAGFAIVRPVISDMLNKEFSQEDLDKAKAELSEEELSEADRVYRQYHNYFLLEETQLDHINHSLFMSMDQESAVNAQRSYLVNSDLTGLVLTLKELVLTRQLDEQLAQILEDPDYAAYVEELVTVTDSTWQNWEEIVMGGREGTGTAYAVANGSDVGVLNRDKNTSVLTIAVIAPNEEYGDRMLDVIDAQLQNVLSDLTKLDDQMSITEFERSVKPIVSDEVYSERSSLLSATTNIVTERRKFAETTVDKLDKAQQGYIELLMLRDNVKEPEAKESRGLVKFTAIGAILGSTIFMCIILVPYVLGGMIRTSSEAERLTGTRKLQANAEMVAGELISWQKNCEAEPSHFFLTGGDNKEAEDTLISDITTSLSEGVCIKAGDPLSDPEALSDMLSAQGIILCVSIDKTKRDKLKAVCRMATDHKVPILGYIPIVQE